MVIPSQRSRSSSQGSQYYLVWQGLTKEISLPNINSVPCTYIKRYRFNTQTYFSYSNRPTIWSLSTKAGLRWGYVETRFMDITKNFMRNDKGKRCLKKKLHLTFPKHLTWDMTGIYMNVTSCLSKFWLKNVLEQHIQWLLHLHRSAEVLQYTISTYKVQIDGVFPLSSLCRQQLYYLIIQNVFCKSRAITNNDICFSISIRAKSVVSFLYNVLKGVWLALWSAYWPLTSVALVQSPFSAHEWFVARQVVSSPEKHHQICSKLL